MEGEKGCNETKDKNNCSVYCGFQEIHSRWQILQPLSQQGTREKEK